MHENTAIPWIEFFFWLAFAKTAYNYARMAHCELMQLSSFVCILLMLHFAVSGMKNDRP